ncbi:hypothetical protein BDV96DRAFT_593160 [Lophiotrema nucula]|uniref:DUF6594 domain-containing protein n=1 Tax=Lophiotrema nucula TaxID=690887 RepID=A0A6A5ZU96_9PLEO|nr:hypothetical protein BDV96DRAFT_593160 [Lophiotrema nucula]
MQTFVCLQYFPTWQKVSKAMDMNSSPASDPLAKPIVTKERRQEKSEADGQTTGDVVVPIDDSRPSSPHNVSSPAQWSNSHNFLSVPGARSRGNSLDSAYSDILSGVTSSGGSFMAQRYGPDPVSFLFGCENATEQRDDVYSPIHSQSQTLDLLNAPHNSLGGYGYSKEEQDAILLDIANRSHKNKKLVLQRFSRLANFCLLQYQHDLAKFDERIVENKGKLDEMETQRVRSLLIDYYSSVRAMSEISKVSRPSLKDTRDFGGIMACRLHEAHYWESPDALNLFALRERSPGYTPDSVRYSLQNWLPEWFLDQAGKDRRTIERKKRETGLKGGTAKIVEAFQSEAFHISPATDRLARLIIGFVGCVFLLVPMTAMIFLPIHNIKVSSFIVTVVAVVLFAATMSLGTGASNQELLAATAAYTAVLVVFLGSAVTPPK